MTSNLVIFGAGASKGSDIENTPPLGNELFSILTTRYPNVWGNIPNEFTDLFESDFEKGMDKISIQHPEWLPSLQRTMASYFFQFIPLPSNIYLKFSEKIIKNSWNGCLATLNYERLLEISLRTKGIQPKISSNTINSNVELCFPHGCCHIFNEGLIGSGVGLLKNGVTFERGGVINFGQNGSLNFGSNGITTGGKIILTHNQIEFNRRIQNSFPPVMSYFMPSKFTTSGEEFIKTQRTSLRNYIHDANVICIIGVFPRDHDSHIWEHLSKTSAKIVYCSGKPGGAEFKKWSKRNNRNSSEDVIFQTYWNESFDELCSCINLD